MTRSSRSASPVKELDAEDRRDWSGAARSDQLVELLEVAERLQAEIVRAVGEWDARADWSLDGALEPADVADAPGTDHGRGRVEAGGHGPPGPQARSHRRGTPVG